VCASSQGHDTPQVLANATDTPIPIGPSSMAATSSQAAARRQARDVICRWGLKCPNSSRAFAPKQLRAADCRLAHLEPPRNWLPNHTASENRACTIVVPFPIRERRQRFKRFGPPRVTRLLVQAEQFQRLLDPGEVASRAALARRFRLTRAQVTQILNLLKLCPEIQHHVRSLDSDTPERLVTEARLRKVSQLSHEDQRVWAEHHLPAW